MAPSFSRFALPVLVTYLLFLATSNAQCTFQGTLGRRDELVGQHLNPHEPALEEKRSVNRHERAQALAEVQVEKRAACNSDNVLRALLARSSSATSFCQTFINIPTATKTISVPGVTATVFTQIVGIGERYYPNGQHIESVSIPTFVSQYPATRISSACTCLSIPTTTTTTTYSESTMYATISTTLTYTVSGPCATQTPYPGAHQLGSSSPAFSVAPGVGTNAYDCCVNCNDIPYTNNCAAWISTPGSCLFLKGPFQYRGPPCPSGKGNGEVGVDVGRYPNNLGGRGRCAGEVRVCGV
ncbi:hypothetical protein MMC24_005366 [Lignoscripta atroalba]|nr:hypothetical protein [Lignoscripta atroalba]